MDNMSFDQWRKLLGVAPVFFQFIKLDGSIRFARGTRNIVIGAHLGYPEIKNETIKSESPFSYFDFDKRDWRSFSPRCNTQILVFDSEDEYIKELKKSELDAL